jgi:hypothetical protein
MEKYFVRFSKTPVIILTIVLFLLTNFGFSFMFGEINAAIPDLLLFYTAEEIYQLIDSYGSQGREVYIKGMFTLDFIYPFIYSVMLSLLLFRATKTPAISLLPFSILFLDIFENITLLTIVYNFPIRMNLIASAAGVITLLKWIMVLFTVVMLVYFGSKIVLQKRKSKNDFS